MTEEIKKNDFPYITTMYELIFVWVNVLAGFMLVPWIAQSNLKPHPVVRFDQLPIQIFHDQDNPQTTKDLYDNLMYFFEKNLALEGKEMNNSLNHILKIIVFEVLRDKQQQQKSSMRKQRGTEKLHKKSKKMSGNIGDLEDELALELNINDDEEQEDDDDEEQEDDSKQEIEVPLTPLLSSSSGGLESISENAATNITMPHFSPQTLFLEQQLKVEQVTVTVSDELQTNWAIYRQLYDEEKYIPTSKGLFMLMMLDLILCQTLVLLDSSKNVGINFETVCKLWYFDLGSNFSSPIRESDNNTQILMIMFRQIAEFLRKIESFKDFQFIPFEADFLYDAWFNHCNAAAQSTFRDIIKTFLKRRNII